MIANFFINAKPINFILLLGALILFYIGAQLNIDLYPLSFKFWALKIAGLLLLIGLFFIYNFIITKNRLTLINSYGLLFICLGFGLFFLLLLDTKLLLAQVILAFSFRRIYSLRSNKNIREKLFDSSFWIALSSLLYFENIYFLILIYVALVAFQRNYWNYFVIPIIGFLLPYFLIYIYALSFDDFSYLNKIITVSVSLNLALFSKLIPLVYIGIFVVTGLIAYIINTVKTSEFSIEFRALWSLIFIHFILAVFLLFSGSTFSINKSVYLLFPFGIIMANYIQLLTKRWQKEVIVYFFIGLTLSHFIL